MLLTYPEVLMYQKSASSGLQINLLTHVNRNSGPIIAVDTMTESRSQAMQSDFY
jgi:hypothetical protein